MAKKSKKKSLKVIPKSKQIVTDTKSKQQVKSRRKITPPRQLKIRTYKWYQPRKPIKHPVRLPSVWVITKEAAQLVWEHKKLFLGITIIYGLLTIILVQGFSGSTDVSSLKNNFNQAFKGNFGGLASGLGVFFTLLGSSGSSSSATSGPYQLLLGIVTSLAIIWALRQLFAGNNIRIRDTFYRGMYPLIPFLIVLIIVCLQLVPFLIGAKLYSTVISGGIAVALIEKLFWIIVFVALTAWSLYMVSRSVIALYIVTLLDMTPISALRSAKDLVQHRRWTVLRKMLSLPIVLLLCSIIIMLPVILIITPASQWVFFFLSMFSLVAIHAYLYTLYRELLNE